MKRLRLPCNNCLSELRRERSLIVVSKQVAALFYGISDGTMLEHFRIFQKIILDH